MSEDLVQNGPGAPTLYSKERAKLIIRGARRGGSKRAAAAAGGISTRTLNRWLEQYPDFAEEWEIARGQFEDDQLQRIAHAASPKDEGGEGQWTASAWLLERVFPESYSLMRERVAQTQISDVIPPHIAVQIQQVLIQQSSQSAPALTNDDVVDVEALPERKEPEDSAESELAASVLSRLKGSRRSG